MIEYKQIIEEKTIIKPVTVLEIGSRDGIDAEKLRGYFGIESKNVWVVEPNPTQQQLILKNYPEINLITNPIFNEEKTLTFYGVDVEDQILNGVSSLLDRVDKLYDKINTNKISVKSILGSTLVKMINKDIDVCKIDVEGATYEVLDSFGDELNKIKTIHVECEHRPVWINQKLYDEVSQFLIDKGYKQVYFSYCNNDTLQSDSIWVQQIFCND
jgi:FkbM family methyltransferase